LRTAVPFLVVFLADHPSTYRMAGLRRGTATSSSTRVGTTSALMLAPLAAVPANAGICCHRCGAVAGVINGSSGSLSHQQPLR